ncbi:carcinoembryonic antigen-related cell adhesion molecule 1-like [Mugil cephalus]|uniref:carcinoembryonic antigen-related cell adhesion molecule 1-like n=1 Tax=Mugil cephalus TaxID=48193 RepID=UPI001FB74C73|nr:carcinoembryonic antigen-related cell adhesion molecule 1-like [Mugil cephalus]
MCSHNQTSVAESCSITYPRAYEVNVQRNSNESSVAVSCTTSCPVSDLQTDYRWYQNRQLSDTRKSQEFSVSPTKSLSCAVKDQDHLLSPEVCPDEENCWTVNYISRRICALKGSSVNISSEYSHPHKKKPESKSWYKVETSGEQLIEDAGRVVFHDNKKNQHVLTIKNLKKEDSAEYKFRLQGDDEERKRDDVPGVTLVVTGLKVRLRPAVVTEGGRVSLTCGTSCPLPTNTNYIWYFNNRPLNLTNNQNKHLFLDPVSSQDAGNYYCCIKNGTKSTCSSEKTLTVQRTTGTSAVATGVSAALLVLILLVFIYWFSRKKKRTSVQVPTTEAKDNTRQLNNDHDELHYSEIQFTKNQTDNIQPRRVKGEEQATYTVVSFRPNTNPE